MGICAYMFASRPGLRLTSAANNGPRVVIGSVILSAALCVAATKFQEYPAHPANECSVQGETDGLLIGAQPLSANDQETYFRTKLSAKGVLPVYLVFENSSAQESFYFDNAKITYGASAYAAPNVTGSPGTVALAVLVSPLFMNHDFELQRNMLRRELRSATISPGASVRGFLYVRMGKGSGESSHLRIPVVKASSGEDFVVDLRI